MAEELPFPLFTNCKFAFSDKILNRNDNLHKLITNKLQFKIIGFDPLVIEKGNPSQEDICTLFDSVKELLKVPETLEVPEFEGYVFVNDLDDDRREPEGLGATGRKVKSRDLTQVQSKEASEVDKQFTKHVQENDDEGYSLMMSSQQETLIDNDETSTLITMFQRLDVNNGTVDKECSIESNGTKRSDLFNNEINRGESTQAIHIEAGASSDLSLEQTKSIQIDSKSSLPHVTQDSLESHVTEREHNNNANEGREDESQLRKVNRQNNNAEDSSNCKEVLTQPELADKENTVVTDKLEQDQEFLNSVSDLSGFPCGMDYKENKEIIETASKKSESDHTIDRNREMHNISYADIKEQSDLGNKLQVGDSKIFSREGECENATNSSISARKMEPRDHIMKQEEPCVMHEITSHSGVAIVKSSVQLDNESKTHTEERTCEVRLQSTNITEDCTKLMAERELIAEVHTLGHTTDETEKQTENIQDTQEYSEPIEITESPKASLSITENLDNTRLSGLSQSDRDIQVNKLYKRPISEMDTEQENGFTKPITAEKYSIDAQKLDYCVHINRREMTCQDLVNEEYKEEPMKSRSEQRLKDGVWIPENPTDTPEKQKDTVLREMKATHTPFKNISHKENLETENRNTYEQRNECNNRGPSESLSGKDSGPAQALKSSEMANYHLDKVNKETRSEERESNNELTKLQADQRLSSKMQDLDSRDETEKWTEGRQKDPVLKEKIEVYGKREELKNWVPKGVPQAEHCEHANKPIHQRYTHVSVQTLGKKCYSSNSDSNQRECLEIYDNITEKDQCREDVNSLRLQDSKYTIPKKTSASTEDQQTECESSKNKTKEKENKKNHQLANRQNPIHGPPFGESNTSQHEMMIDRIKQNTLEKKEAEVHECRDNLSEEQHAFHPKEPIPSSSYYDNKSRNQTKRESDISRMSEESEQFEDHERIQAEKIYRKNSDKSSDFTENEERSKSCRHNTDIQVLESNLRSKPDGQKNNTQKQNVLQKSLNQHSYTKQENSDSSASDEESHEIIYSLKASSFHVAKTHFMNSNIQSYFDRAVREGTGFTFKLDAHHKRDVAFLKKVKCLKFEELEFEQEDMAFVKSAVKCVQSEVDKSILAVKDNKVHIIGSKDVVALAKKKLNSQVHDQNPKSLLTSENVHRNEMDKLVAKEKIEPHNNDVPGYKSTGKIPKSIGSHDFMGHPKTLQSFMEELEKDSSSSALYERPSDFKTNEVSGSTAYSETKNDYRIVMNNRNLKVLSYKASITELETDCIVNAANKRLQHYGGVAKVIAIKAGSALTKECEEFINSGKNVHVTHIFVSTGGKLRTKYVIHAVGPKWDDYQEKIKCFEDLRHTVLRCLVEAGRRGMTSIALPSISAAIFKVPKEECARCYMEAVKHFDAFNATEKLTLREIHFVDIDETMVNYIRESFLKGWLRPSNVETVQKDYVFAKQHLDSRNETENCQRKSGHENKSSDQNKTTSSVPRSSTVASTIGSAKKSEVKATYQIEKITLVVDVRPAFDQRADFTITIGQPFDKLSGLQDFQIPSSLERQKDMSYSKNVYKFVNVSKPGGKRSRSVCMVYPDPKDPDKVEEAFKNIEAAIRSSVQNVKTMVLTSSILYPVPSNKKPKGNSSYDRKKVGKFAQCVYDFLMRRARDTQETVRIIVAGSEDAVLAIEKVLESRDVKKIAAGANPGAGSGSDYGRGKSGSDHGSYSQGNPGAGSGSDYGRGKSGSDHGSYSQGNPGAGSGSDYGRGKSGSDNGSYSQGNPGAGSGSDYGRGKSGSDNGSYSQGNLGAGSGSDYGRGKSGSDHGSYSQENPLHDTDSKANPGAGSGSDYGRGKSGSDHGSYSQGKPGAGSGPDYGRGKFGSDHGSYSQGNPGAGSGSGYGRGKSGSDHGSYSQGNPGAGSGSDYGRGKSGSDHGSYSQENPLHDTDSKGEANPGAGNGSDYRPRTESGLDHKHRKGSGSEDRPRGVNGSEDRSRGGSGSDDKSRGRSGSEDRPRGGSGSEDWPRVGSGSEGRLRGESGSVYKQEISGFDYGSTSQGNLRHDTVNMQSPDNVQGGGFHGGGNKTYYGEGMPGYQPGHFSDQTKIPRRGYVGSSVDSELECLICADNKLGQPVMCCRKRICPDCQQKTASCPFCNTFWRIKTGNQPPGTMNVKMIPDHADGYEDIPAWRIEYYFPSGMQQEWHPNPGQMYKAVSRTAYLPANEEGFFVLRLLRLAFIRKLTFTIGHSLTTNTSGSIIWNDIHHKTCLHGGTYGYPDPQYFFRVITELANKGVKLDHFVTESEKYQLDNFSQNLSHFTLFVDKY